MTDTVDYVAFSGGADSTALAIYLHERGDDFELVFADTGVELPETYYMVTAVGHALGRDVTVVSNGSFYQLLTHFGFMLPSGARRWCTDRLKRTPQDRHYAKGSVVALGIRADEAHRMEARGFARPLVDAGFDRAAVMDLCRKWGLEHPAYKWRSSVSCFCCPFQRKWDWLGLHRTHPELYALAEQWEGESIRRTKTAYTWSPSFSLGQLRTASERQVALWPEPEDEPCAICSV